MMEDAAFVDYAALAVRRLNSRTPEVDASDVVLKILQDCSGSMPSGDVIKILALMLILQAGVYDKACLGAALSVINLFTVMDPWRDLEETLTASKRMLIFNTRYFD